MNVIKTFAHHTWEAYRISLITINKSLNLFKIAYESQIYNTAKPNPLKILDPLHNEGILLLIGAFKTSQIDSILNYVGETPLQLQKDQDTLIHTIKRKSTTNHIGHKIIYKNSSTFSTNVRYQKPTSVRDIFTELQTKSI